MAIDGLTREDLSTKMVEVLREGKPWQPDILLVRLESGQAVVKDYAPRGFLYRFFVGVWSTWREAAIYRKLAGIRGIPSCLGKIDRHALAIEYIPGKTASKFKRGELSPEFFIKLRRVIDAVHDRGIVLCDMRNNKNVIVTEAGDPVLIDFCTAFGRGSRLNFIRTGIYNIFYRDDLLGIAKLKKNLAPELMTPHEREGLEKGLPFQKEVILVRDVVRGFLKKLVA